MTSEAIKAHMFYSDSYPGISYMDILNMSVDISTPYYKGLNFKFCAYAKEVRYTYSKRNSEVD